MKYEHIVSGTFLARPNRFLARVKIKEEVHTVHVKNTGRCRELLVPGAKILLEYDPEAKAKERKTEYSLVGVYKGDMLVNMDSQAPNQAAGEWLENGGFERSLGICAAQIRREAVYGQSRFDLAFLADQKPAFMEVKGVTLEEAGIAKFPDAPTERGVKHLLELADAVKQGFEAYVLFVIQMKGIKKFCPNWAMHEAFGHALEEAAQQGVHVLAYDCLVKEDGFIIDQPVKVERIPL